MIPGCSPSRCVEAFTTPICIDGDDEEQECLRVACEEGETREKSVEGQTRTKAVDSGADEGQRDNDTTLPVEECVNKKQPTLQVVQMTKQIT